MTSLHIVLAIIAVPFGIYKGYLLWRILIACRDKKFKQFFKLSILMIINDLTAFTLAELAIRTTYGSPTP